MQSPHAGVHKPCTARIALSCLFDLISAIYLQIRNDSYGRDTRTQGAWPWGGSDVNDGIWHWNGESLPRRAFFPRRIPRVTANDLRIAVRRERRRRQPTGNDRLRSAPKLGPRAQDGLGEKTDMLREGAVAQRGEAGSRGAVLEVRVAVHL